VLIGTSILLEFFLCDPMQFQRGGGFTRLAMLYSSMACLLKFIAKVEMTLLIAILMVIFELGLIFIVPLKEKRIQRLFVFWFVTDVVLFLNLYLVKPLVVQSYVDALGMGAVDPNKPAEFGIERRGSQNHHL
jgi:hypothetical protein